MHCPKGVCDCVGWVSNERLLQVCMMTDATDEADVFLRLWDYTQGGPARISVGIQGFTNCWQLLFVDGVCAKPGRVCWAPSILSTACAFKCRIAMELRFRSTLARGSTYFYLY